MLRRAYLCLIGLVVWLPAQATTVLALHLDEIVDTAAVVFQGKCIDNRTERDAATNLVVTYTTFEVQDVLKGPVSTIHVIKQIGGSLPDEMLTYEVHGVPTFSIGQSYVVFLAGVSSAGFSSPIGLGQGKFSVTPGTAGFLASNGRDFKAMTAPIPAQLIPPEAQQPLQAAGSVREMDLDAFKLLVRQLARGLR